MTGRGLTQSSDRNLCLALASRFRPWALARSLSAALPSDELKGGRTCTARKAPNSAPSFDQGDVHREGGPGQALSSHSGGRQLRRAALPAPSHSGPREERGQQDDCLLDAHRLPDGGHDPSARCRTALVSAGSRALAARIDIRDARLGTVKMLMNADPREVILYGS